MNYYKYTKYKNKYINLKRSNDELIHIINTEIMFLFHLTSTASLKLIMKDKLFIPYGARTQKEGDAGIGVYNKFFTSIVIDSNDIIGLAINNKYDIKNVFAIIDKRVLLDKKYYQISYYDSFGDIDKYCYFSEPIYNIINKAKGNTTKYIELVNSDPSIDSYVKNVLTNHEPGRYGYMANRKNTRDLSKVICRNRVFTGIGRRATTAEFLEPVETSYIIGLYFPDKQKYLEDREFFDSLNLKIYFKPYELDKYSVNLDSNRCQNYPYDMTYEPELNY